MSKEKGTVSKKNEQKLKFYLEKKDVHIINIKSDSCQNKRNRQ